MPRIRSIKPSFWTDGKNLTLSDSCALFFIGLWNFCDDEGKHPLDYGQIASELGGRWHRGKIKLFVSCLIKTGQLRINSASTWLQVVHFSHQRIDNPKQPKVKAEDLQWVTNSENGIDQEKYLGIPARIGEDRIGKEKKEKEKEKENSEQGVKKRTESSGLAPAFLQNPPNSEHGTQAFMETYRTAFKKRYGDDPELLAADYGKIKNLLQTVPLQTAQDLAQVFLQMNGKNDWYRTKGHDLGTFIANLNAIKIALRDGTESDGKLNWDRILAGEKNP